MTNLYPKTKNVPVRINHAQLIAWKMITEDLNAFQLCILKESFLEQPCHTKKSIRSIFLYYSQLLLNDVQPKNFDAMWKLAVSLLKSSKKQVPEMKGIFTIPTCLLGMVSSFLDAENYLAFGLTSRTIYSRIMQKIEVKKLFARQVPPGMQRFSNILQLKIEFIPMVQKLDRCAWQVLNTICFPDSIFSHTKNVDASFGTINDV